MTTITSSISLDKRNSLLRSITLGVYIIMNFIVLSLSAAPPLPAPPIPWLIESILEHILLVGLPLGILVRQNANTN